jgi:hypothetical protein
VLFPLLLICGAASSAAIVAYGTSPELAQYAHGVQLIVLSRRLEWPMVAISLALSGALLGAAISGRRSVWWLLGLGPVVALFIRAFSSSYHPSIGLLDSPQFSLVTPNDSASLAQESVLGFIFDGKPYALPYRAMAGSPLVLISAFEKRALVVWSMTANRAVVLPLDRDTVPRDIEVVSRPADSLLLFDTRLGQFIVGVTGRTVNDAKPIGFGAPIAVEKMRFPRWIAKHPDTLLMQTNFASAAAPSGPVFPLLHFRADPGGPAGATRIGLFATTQPTAVLSDISIDHPLNLQAGETRLLLERDQKTQMLRAFDRHVKEDLFLTLTPLARPSRKHPDAVMIDSDTDSLWSLDGRAVDGPLKGARLHEIAVDDGLYWGVMKFWIPQLKLIEAK